MAISKRLAAAAEKYGASPAGQESAKSLGRDAAYLWEKAVAAANSPGIARNGYASMADLNAEANGTTAPTPGGALGGLRWTLADSGRRLEDRSRALELLAAGAQQEPDGTLRFGSGRDLEAFQTVQQSAQREAGRYGQAAEQYDAAITRLRGQAGIHPNGYAPVADLRRDSAAIRAEIEALDREESALMTQNAQELTRRYLAGEIPRNAAPAQPEDRRAAIRAWRAQLEQEAAALEEREKRNSYAYLRGSADFQEKSQYQSTANGKRRSALDVLFDDYSEETSGWDDPLYEYINGNEGAGVWLRQYAGSLYGNGAENAIGRLWGAETENHSEAAQLTADEIAVYNYLHATQGRQAAEEYYEFLLGDLNARQRAAEELAWAAYAAENPTESSLFSIVAGPSRTLSYLSQAVDYLTTGEVDQNAAYNRPVYTNSAIRGQIAKTIEDSGKWGKVGSFAYQTGMSMGDFLFNSAITGGLSGVGGAAEKIAGNLALGIMGSGAAADATISAKDRGLSDDQAFALGTIAGAAEILTERVSLETLLDKTALSQSAAGYFLKNTLAEGSEEVASDLINTMADVLISREKSDWRMAVSAYQAEGLSDGEAFGQAFLDQATALGVSFLGGAVSGGVMSGAGIGMNAAMSEVDARRNGAQFRAMGDDVMDAVIQEGLASAHATESYRRATQLQEKLAAGQQISNRELGRLYQANVAAIAAEEQNAAASPESREAAQDAAPASKEEPAAPPLERRQATRQTAQSSPTLPQTHGQEAAQLRQYANAFGEHGRRALLAAYDGESRSDGYYAAFSAYYQAGLTGQEQKQVRPAADVLSEAQKYAAYAAGQNDAAASLRRETAAVKPKDMAAALVQNEQARAIPKEQADFLDQLARGVGVKIELTGSLADNAGRPGEANGVYLADSNTIRLAMNAGKPLLTVASHELTHHLQNTAPETYRAYRDYANRAVSEHLGTEAVEEVMERYARHGLELTLEEAMDEVAAEFAEAMVQDGKLFQDLARENRTVAQKVLDAVKTFLEKVRAVLTRSTQDSVAMEKFGVDMDTLEQAAKLWQEAFDAAETGTENAAQAGGVQYSINQNYESDIQEWYESGRPENERFTLGSTGPVLQGLGAIESDIYMDGGKISAILEKHPEMTVREIQRIPDILEDPVLILKSQNKGRNPKGNSRLVLFGSVKAQDGRPVMCVLDLRPTENGFLLDDMQRVNSAYTKDTNPTDFISRSEVLHADKKRTIPLLRSIGFETPTALLRNGSIGSISYTGTTVNLSGRHFSDVVTAADQAERPVNVQLSLKEESTLRAEDIQALRRENEQLQERVEYFKGQTRLTKQATTDRKSVERTARQLVKDYGADLDVSEIAGDLQGLYDYIAGNGDGKNELTYEDARARAEAIGRKVVENAVERDSEVYRTYEDLRKFLRGARLSISEADSKDFSDFNDFRKQNFGRMTVSKGETNVDQAYLELSQLWPEFFDEQEVSHPADQLRQIAEVLDGVYRITERNPFSANLDRAAAGVANEILEAFFDLPQTKPTWSAPRRA